jgi:hypothetical protein
MTTGLACLCCRLFVCTMGDVCLYVDKEEEYKSLLDISSSCAFEKLSPSSLHVIPRL